jgi:ASC-1-like (ASCH) protein
MSPELIKLTKKVDSFREVLKEHGFEKLECFWYADGRYCGNWKDMKHKYNLNFYENV